MTTSGGTIIELRDVSKHYRRGAETVAALSGVSLAIKKGDLISIIGPSGSGKTTLTHIIGGLLTPDEGELIVDGKPLKKRSDKALSNYRNTKIGFVFQNFSLIPHYTSLENVTLPLIVAGMSGSKRRARAKELLQSVGLDKRMNQRVDRLSGGERQRVSIARALAAEPEILIADEPTGSLDSVRGSEIMSVLETLNSKQGITVIIVTHDPKIAARTHQIIKIQDGKIAGVHHA